MHVMTDWEPATTDVGLQETAVLVAFVVTVKM
jgi:hypothetical protein